MSTRPVFGLVLAAAMLGGFAAQARPKPKSVPQPVQKEPVTAVELMAAGRYAEACPKFEAEYRAQRSFATQFFLADCYEKVGKTASAWKLFRQASAVAASARAKDRARTARERAAGLAPRLSRVTVLTSSVMPGLVVTCDGQVLPRHNWAKGVPVDPGEHWIEATAPDKQPWKDRVRLGENGARVQVQVPKLQDTPRPAEVAAPAPSPTDYPDDAGSKHSSQKTWAAFSTALGLVGVGVGATLVITARSTYREANSFCDDANNCSDKGVALRDDAIERANLATIPLGAGAAFLGLGVTLWLTAPSNPSSTGLMPSPTRLIVRGKF